MNSTHFDKQERLVLGQLMCNPMFWNNVSTSLEIRYFRSEKHREIFVALAHLYEGNKSAHALAVSDQLKFNSLRPSLQYLVSLADEGHNQPEALEALNAMRKRSV